MIVLSQSDARKQFNHQSMPANEQVLVDEFGPFYAHPEADCIFVSFEEKIERFSFMARCLAAVNRDAVDFRGAISWVQEYGVWDELDEAVGIRLVEKLNIAAGQPMAFEKGNSHSFRADEFFESVGMLLQPIIFGWDAVYLPTWAYGRDDFFTFVSHDSYAVVVTRTKDFHSEAVKWLESLKLKINPSHAPSKGRFCRTSDIANVR